MSELIVMLTHHDMTVKNAIDVFTQCKDTKAKYWGFKEAGLDRDSMKKLVGLMKAAGKTTFLEVVAYTEKECLDGAKVCAECGFDFLMGTLYFDSVNEYTKRHKLKYMPFVGTITGRPSVVTGTIEGIIEEGKRCVSKGVFGIDLLGYRFVGDCVRLNSEFVRQVPLPVVLAGSVDSMERLKEVKDTGAFAFTIGSAFFENKFGGTFAQQIDKVIGFMES